MKMLSLIFCSLFLFSSITAMDDFKRRIALFQTQPKITIPQELRNVFIHRKITEESKTEEYQINYNTIKDQQLHVPFSEKSRQKLSQYIDPKLISLLEGHITQEKSLYETLYALQGRESSLQEFVSNPKLKLVDDFDLKRLQKNALKILYEEERLDIITERLNLERRVTLVKERERIKQDIAKQQKKINNLAMEIINKKIRTEYKRIYSKIELLCLTTYFPPRDMQHLDAIRDRFRELRDEIYEIKVLSGCWGQDKLLEKINMLWQKFTKKIPSAFRTRPPAFSSPNLLTYNCTLRLVDEI